MKNKMKMALTVICLIVFQAILVSAGSIGNLDYKDKVCPFGSICDTNREINDGDVDIEADYAKNSGKLDGKHGKYYTGYTDDGDDEIRQYLAGREVDYTTSAGGNSITWLSSVIFGSSNNYFISNLGMSLIDYFDSKYVLRSEYVVYKKEMDDRVDVLEAKYNLGKGATQEEIDMEACFVGARRTDGTYTTDKMSCSVKV